MMDYGEMRRAVKRVNERMDSLAGCPCPKGSCFGTLRRDGATVRCDSCADDAPVRDPFGRSARRSSQ